MANIVITATTTKIKFEFNVLNTVVGLDKATVNIANIQSVRLETGGFVSIVCSSGDIYRFTYNASDYLLVDSVAGVAPASNSDLYDKISALL